MSETKPFYKQYGQTLKLSGVGKEPLTITISNKDDRELKKTKINSILEEYESTKSKTKRDKLEKRLKALFENTEARQVKEAEDKKKALETQKKANKAKKAKEKIESVDGSIDFAIEQLEKASEITEDKRSRLQKLLDKLSGKKSKTIERQRSGRGGEY